MPRRLSQQNKQVICAFCILILQNALLRNWIQQKQEMKNLKSYSSTEHNVRVF